MEDVTFRRATPADRERLVSLALQLRDFLRQAAPSEADFREGFAALLGDPTAEFLLALDARGAGVGYVQMRYRRSAWTSGLQAELEDVFVAESARQRGVGRGLLDLAVARAMGRGCGVIGLTTNERNGHAMTLYRHFGFAAKRSRWDGGRQLWLEKPLQ